MDKVGISIIIEREGKGSETVFIASSPDINVFAEGGNIDEAKEKFIEGVKYHLETFPEEKESLMKEENLETPMIQKIFL